MPLLAVTYLAVFGIGLFLGAFLLLIWRNLPERREFLFAAIMGASAGIIGLCEAALLRVSDPEMFKQVFMAQNIAVGAMLISMIWFVRVRLNTGRIWLAWAITAAWGSLILLGFYGLLIETFLGAVQLEPFSTDWGETYFVPRIETTPALFMAELTTVAIILFVLDATLQAFRRGQRNDAVWVGGTILFFIVVAGVQTPLVDRGIIKTPYLISPIFITIVIGLTVGLVQDVARGAALSRQLQIERDRWDALLDGVQLAVLRLGADGRIAYVNPFTEVVVGRTSADLQGRSVETLLPAGDGEQVRELVKQAGAWTSRSNSLRRIVTASNEVRDLLWFSVALRDDAGQPDGVIAFGQDITEQIAAQAERDLARQEIEKLSRVLTMGEMASTFAHELSQPIAAVLSNAQALEIIMRNPESAAEEHREILEDIIHQTRRARDLMNRVRAFIFDEEPQRTRFELGDLIFECLDMVRTEASRHSVRLDTVSPGSPMEVHAARTEIQQVVINMVANGIQAAGEAKDGVVQVSWRRSDDGMAEITFNDNGPGLLPELGTTALDAFVTTKEAGSGIGLAVCNRVAKRHGGSIRFDQGPMGGARFEVLIDI